MRASITFVAGQSSEIGRYEVHREASLPGLGIGMTIDDLQIAWIRRFVIIPVEVGSLLTEWSGYHSASGPR